jgi:hypothetical protein
LRTAIACRKPGDSIDLSDDDSHGLSVILGAVERLCESAANERRIEATREKEQPA